MTYSIVARDPDSGELGVAVQSHWFSVGSVVTWAAAGVGAVATQANAEASYGPRALGLLEAGLTPAQALERLRAQDAAEATRQVALVDRSGAVAAHTGSLCIPCAGHLAGEQACCQANIMVCEAVWPAMLAGYQAADGPLSRRLLAALRAGEDAGGDLRGRQSAALLVVPAEGERWRTTVSLRVEDHPAPLDELARLLDLHDAYRLASEADELSGSGRHEEAGDRYRQAAQLAPGNLELRFWAALGAAQAGEMEQALAEVRAVIELAPAWRELLARIPPQIAPVAAAVLDRL